MSSLAATQHPTIDTSKSIVHKLRLGDTLDDASTNPVPRYAVIQYNHTADPSGNKVTSTVNQPDTSTHATLTRRDGDSTYLYTSTASTPSDQAYILLPHQDGKSYILEKVGLQQDFNLSQTPTESDAQTLKRRYPHLDNSRPEIVDRDPDEPSPDNPFDFRNSIELQPSKESTPEQKPSPPPTKSARTSSATTHEHASQALSQPRVQASVNAKNKPHDKQRLQANNTKATKTVNPRLALPKLPSLRASEDTTRTPSRLGDEDIDLEAQSEESGDDGQLVLDIPSQPVQQTRAERSPAVTNRRSGPVSLKAMATPLPVSSEEHNSESLDKDTPATQATPAVAEDEEWETQMMEALEEDEPQLGTTSAQVQYADEEEESEEE